MIAGYNPGYERADPTPAAAPVRPLGEAELAILEHDLGWQRASEALRLSQAAGLERQLHGLEVSESQAVSCSADRAASARLEQLQQEQARLESAKRDRQRRLEEVRASTIAEEQQRAAELQRIERARQDELERMRAAEEAEVRCLLRAALAGSLLLPTPLNERAAAAEKGGRGAAAAGGSAGRGEEEAGGAGGR